MKKTRLAARVSDLGLAFSLFFFNFSWLGVFLSAGLSRLLFHCFPLPEYSTPPRLRFRSRPLRHSD